MQVQRSCCLTLPCHARRHSGRSLHKEWRLLTSSKRSLRAWNALRPAPRAQLPAMRRQQRVLLSGPGCRSLHLRPKERSPKSATAQKRQRRLTRSRRRRESPAWLWVLHRLRRKPCRPRCCLWLPRRPPVRRCRSCVAFLCVPGWVAHADLLHLCALGTCPAAHPAALTSCNTRKPPGRPEV